MRLLVVPLGDVPRDLLADISHALAKYGLRCQVGEGTPLPAEAFHPERGKYRAEELLRLVVPREEAVLAVTPADMYADDLSFVFGLANLGRPGAVVSVHRLRSPDRERFLGRVVKESVHELGHTWGLPHCSNDACVMAFSNSLEMADAKGQDFCESCRRVVPIATDPTRA
ncbi:MAG: archaemetzincin family Zn-dependent metalloprotease [Euryarchaeota archaeon]|nr:archaemetzincin family Zn-dependent metalloprotease [Euryarchaeota archaeon]